LPDADYNTPGESYHTIYQKHSRQKVIEIRHLVTAQLLPLIFVKEQEKISSLNEFSEIKINDSG
jgi:hypothetical protein